MLPRTNPTPLVISALYAQTPFVVLENPNRIIYKSMIWGASITDPDTNILTEEEYDALFTYTGRITQTRMKQLAKDRNWDIGAAYLDAFAEHYCIRNIVSYAGEIPAAILPLEFEFTRRAAGIYIYRRVQGCSPESLADGGSPTAR
jgi:hypothetical protein